MLSISRFSYLCGKQHERDMATLGITIKEARKRNGFTLKQVEDALGISNAYLSQLENEKIKSPSANILYKLSSLYGVQLKDLLASAGMIEKKEESLTSEHSDFVERIAFSSENMSADERAEVLRFLEYLKSKK